MEDRADLLRRRIELYRGYLREGIDLPVAAAPLRIRGLLSPPVFRRNLMSADGRLSRSQIHSRLDHPIIDGDGHWVEYDDPVQRANAEGQSGRAGSTGEP
jgi:hypothetical protein